MTTIEIAGQHYQLAKLNALTQFHVARRLGPILATMGVSLQMLRSGMKLELDDFVSLLTPVMDIMSKMPDEEVNYILFTCLGVCKRKSGEAWAPVLASGNLIMFSDIDLPTMLQLVVAVLKDNLGPFLMGQSDGPSSPSN